jgi:hypothetical protein
MKKVTSSSPASSALYYWCEETNRIRIRDEQPKVNVKAKDAKKTAFDSSLGMFEKLNRLGALRVRGLTSGGLHYWCEVPKKVKVKVKVVVEEGDEEVTTFEEQIRTCWVCYDDTATELIATDKTLYYEALGIAVVEYALKDCGGFRDPEGFRAFDIVQRMLMYTCRETFPKEAISCLPKHCVYIVFTGKTTYHEIRRL